MRAPSWKASDGGTFKRNWQHTLFRFRFQPEIAALPQAGNPFEELAKGLREHRLHFFVASTEDDLAEPSTRPRVEIETYMVAGAVLGEPYPVRTP